MNRFLFQMSWFTITVILILSLAVTGTYFIISSASFKIPKDKTIIIVGDSHFADGINDSIFSHGINIAQGGTAYLYSYIKLRKIFDENYHINKVLLSFHGGSIQKSIDEWTIGDTHILERVPNYISLLQKEEMLLLKDKPSFFSAVVKIPVKQIRNILKFIFGSDLTYRDLSIGGYIKLDRDKLKKDIALKESEATLQSDEYSQYQHEYLLKIVALCNEKNVELILINAPTYNSEKYGNKLALADYYSTYLSGIKYLDYSDFPLPEYGYGDIGHLNYKGAEIFSRYLEDNYETIFEQ